MKCLPTVHAIWETFQNSLLHVARRNPVPELASCAFSWCRNGVVFYVRADERALLDARYIRGVGSRQPTVCYVTHTIVITIRYITAIYLM